MSAKKFQISPDSGVTYYTFPGDTAALNSAATDIKDTVFGSTFESGQTGIISWSADANGFYKGFAGYVAEIKKGGSPTTMTAEACTLVTTRVYQITSAAHRVIDRTNTVTVKDGGVDHTADVLSIDYLFGTVTFKGTYTVTGSVTIDGKYLPMTQIAKGQSFTLNQTAVAIDTTDFPTAQSNGGFKTVIPGLRTVTLDLGGVFAISNAWLAALTARSEIIVELTPDGSDLAVARGIFKPLSQGQSGKVGELETESVKFTLSVPDPAVYPLLTSPFSWQFDVNTTLSRAVRESILSWQNQTVVNFNYLEDGTNGQTGLGILTDVSLKGGLDVMNEFTIKVMGSGAPSAVGTG